MPNKGVNVVQFRELIVRPPIRDIGFYSPNAENFLVGIALAESGGLHFIKQHPIGPACGPFQMEPGTHDDIYTHFLSYRPMLRQRVISWSRNALFKPEAQEMIGNWYYAAAMARIHLVRQPRQLPAKNDPVGMAEFWKKYYNTHVGKGNVAKALPWFEMACEYDHV